MATGNEDSEVEIVENLNDVELMLQELDPVYWKEPVDKRLESTSEVVKSCYVQEFNYYLMDCYRDTACSLG